MLVNIPGWLFFRDRWDVGKLPWEWEFLHFCVFPVQNPIINAVRAWSFGGIQTAKLIVDRCCCSYGSIRARIEVVWKSIGQVQFKQIVGAKRAVVFHGLKKTCSYLSGWRSLKVKDGQRYQFEVGREGCQTLLDPSYRICVWLQTTNSWASSASNGWHWKRKNFHARISLHGWLYCDKTSIK